MINALKRKPREDAEAAGAAQPPLRAADGKTYAIEARGITKSFRSGQVKVQVLKGIDLLIEPGEIALVMGPSGSGKSTLLAAIAGIIPYVRGEIAILGADLVRDPVAARRNLGLLPERADAFVGLSARAWLTFVAGIRGVAVEPSLEAIGALLDDPSAIDRPMSTLSAGQRRKVALVAATCGEPPLLLLDEPAGGLDLPGREALLAALALLAGEPTPPAVGLVTHHLEELPPSMTHALLLAGGRVCASGAVRGVLADGPLSACFGVAIGVARADGRWTARATPSW